VASVEMIIDADDGDDIVAAREDHS